MVSLLYALLIAAATASPLLKRSYLTPPSQDPFYTPPEGYESESLGTILKTRKLSPGDLAIDSDSVYVDAAYQYLYVTSDTFGNPVATVTTLIVPVNADNSKLLSYQIAEDGSWINCAPSYNIRDDANPAGKTADYELLLIEGALNHGWYVNVPDYEGPKAAFTAGHLAGHAVLDSIRAVLSTSDSSGVATDPSIAMWGYSGGSLATGWAAQMKPSYASELSFVGVALGGTVPNITSVFETINGGSDAGLVPPGIIGLSREYPSFGTYINDSLIEDTKDKFFYAATSCEDGDDDEYEDQDILTYFNSSDILYAEPIASVLSNEQLGYETPDAPLYIYKAIKDEVSPFADTIQLYDWWCSRGVDIQLLEDETASHIELAILGSGDALGFLIDRFDGVPVESGCHSKKVFSALLTVPGLLNFGILLAGDLLGLLGLPAGLLDLIGLKK